jgi:hypothetical protein
MKTLKSPREYAKAYLDVIDAGGDREAQRAAVAGCPAAWRNLVRYYVEIARNQPKRPSKGQKTKSRTSRQNVFNTAKRSVNPSESETSREAAFLGKLFGE